MDIPNKIGSHMSEEHHEALRLALDQQLLAFNGIAKARREKPHEDPDIRRIQLVKRHYADNNLDKANKQLLRAHHNSQ